MSVGPERSLTETNGHNKPFNLLACRSSLSDFDIGLRETAAKARFSSRPLSGGLSHRRPKSIVDHVPPASIRAAAHDIACRASEVHVLAVGTCAIN